MQTSALFSAKNFGVSNLLCVRMDKGEGLSQCGQGEPGRDQFFRDFVRTSFMGGS